MLTELCKTDIVKIDLPHFYYAAKVPIREYLQIPFLYQSEL